jgi:antitoxin PrlF
MAPSSTISSEGQITVPLEIRDRLGLKEGDRLEFVINNGQAIMRPVPPAINPFEAYIGVLPALEGGQTVNEWLADLRDDDRA